MKLSPKILVVTGVLLLVVIGTVVWRRGWQGEKDPGAGGQGTGTEVTGAPQVENGPARVASASDGWKELDDPAADGWESEVLHRLLKKKLALLAQFVISGEPGEEGFGTVVAGEVEGSNLVPTDLEPVWSQGGVVVKRGVGLSGTDYRDPSGFVSAVQMVSRALGGKAETRRCAFKVVAIRPGPAGLQARVSVECARVDGTGVVEQHAEWMTTWQVSPGREDARLVGVILQGFEQSEGPGRLFTDCTESILEANDSYRRQLLRGYPYWLQRIQDTRQMTLLGTPGTALGDVNGDGLEDLYLCQAGGLPNRLYVQRPDGTLRDATAESGTGWVESSRAALLVDLDNDGDQDLAVATYARLVLARNDGSGRFEVMTVLETGIGSMGISAIDFDNDRDLDLYVCHYSRGDLDLEAGATVIGSGGRFVYHDANNAGRNYFFRNEIEGEKWKLQDVTEESGLDVNNRRFSLAAAWEDFDNDGDQDLYVANDFGRNNLYRNDEGSFTDIAPEMMGEDKASGMSVSWGDVNRDGRMDLYIANMFSAAGNRIAPQEGFSLGSSKEVRDALLRFARGNTLLVQEEGRFKDMSEELGVTMGRWAWSSIFTDINNDGWDDLLVANGYITTPDPGDL